MDLLAGPVDARLGDADREREPAALDAADEVADSIPQAALRLCLSGETEAKA